ncbi:MAG: HAMP domain-containing protein, partial [Candidatus Omnitrophota bacterium]
MRIGLKLITVFAGIVLVVGFAGYILIMASQGILRDTIGKTSVRMVRNTLERLDRSVYRRIERIQLYSTSIPLREALIGSNREFEKLDTPREYIDRLDKEWTSAPEEEITPFMEKLINSELSKGFRFYEQRYEQEVFGEIFVTNKYGVNVAQTGKTSDFYQADEEWWQKAREEGLCIEDVNYDESAGVYAIDICVRIDDENGDFIGVIKAVLNIQEVIDIMEAAASTVAKKGHKDPARRGRRTMELKLLTGDGKIIYSTEGSEKFGDMHDEALLHFKTMGDPGHIEYYYIGKGDRPGEGKVLFAYARSRGFKAYKGLGWTLISEQKTKKLFAPIGRLRKILLATVFILIVSTVSAGTFVSRSVAAPLEKLKKAAVEIGKGELDTRIEIKSKDELGALADAFNEMTKDLSLTTTSIDRLNREIAERKRIEENLRESERKYKTLADDLTEVIYSADPGTLSVT